MIGAGRRLRGVATHGSHFQRNDKSGQRYEETHIPNTVLQQRHEIPRIPRRSTRLPIRRLLAILSLRLSILSLRRLSVLSLLRLSVLPLLRRLTVLPLRGLTILSLRRLSVLPLTMRGLTVLPRSGGRRLITIPIMSRRRNWRMLTTVTTGTVRGPRGDGDGIRAYRVS